MKLVMWFLDDCLLSYSSIILKHNKSWHETHSFERLPGQKKVVSNNSRQKCIIRSLLKHLVGKSDYFEIRDPCFSIAVAELSINHQTTLGAPGFADLRNLAHCRSNLLGFEGSVRPYLFDGVVHTDVVCILFVFTEQSWNDAFEGCVPRSNAIEVFATFGASKLVLRWSFLWANCSMFE